jgi:hypothetical protein
VVTSLDNYAWRSDLSKIEVIDAGKNLWNVQKPPFFFQRRE